MTPPALIDIDVPADSAVNAVPQPLLALGAAFHDSDSPVWVMTIDGTPVYTNPSGREVLPGGVALDQSWNGAPSFRSLLDRARQGRFPVHARTSLGGRAYIAVFSPVFDHEERAAGIYVSLSLTV